MAVSLPKPDEQYVTDLKKYRADLWNDTHNKFRTADSYYKRTFAIWDKGPIDRPAYQPSRPTSIIDHAVDQFMSIRPKVKKLPYGEGKEHKDKADRVEPGLGLMFDEIMLKETTLTWKQVFKNTIHYGYGVQEGPLWSDLDKPEEPEKGKDETAEEFGVRQMEYQHERSTWLPIRGRAIHPARVLLDPMERQPKESIKVVKMKGKDIEALALRVRSTGTDAEDWSAKKPYELYDVIEYFSKGWHLVMVDGRVLYVEPNWTRIVPYKHAFSGWGQEPTDNEAADPSHLAVGMLEAVEDGLKIDAQNASGRHNLMVEAMFPQRGAKEGMAADVANQLSRASIYEGQPDDVWWMQIPQLPQWVFHEDSTVQADIEQGTYAKRLAGLHEPGVNTATENMLNSAAAGNKFSPIVVQVTYMAYQFASDILRLIKIKGEHVVVRGKTISPEDIEDFAVEVKFEMVNPVVRDQEKQSQMIEYQAGLLDREGYWSGAGGVEDVSGMKERLLEDELEKMPEVKALLMEATAERVGLFEVAEQLDRMRKEREAGLSTNGNGNGAGELSGLVGLDGQPLISSLGLDTGGLEEVGDGQDSAIARLRQALTPAVQQPAQPPYGRA